MLTVTPRRRKDGTLAYRALVRVKERGRVVYSESKTFSKLALARSWGKKLEQQLEDPDARSAIKHRAVLVGTLIGRYIAEVDLIKPLGRTKRYVLEMLQGEPIAEVRIEDLGSKHVIDHCKARQAEGAGPATVNQDIIYLRLVLAMAKPAWNIPITAAAVDEAMPVLKQLGLVASSQRRERRPTEQELELVMADLERTDKVSMIPMVEIVKYALAAIKRQGEITRILWTDFHEKKRTQVLRDMKDPRKKEGNDFEYPLLGEAFDITKRQPVIDERIFPYEAGSVASRWERACAKVGVYDLTFHDLRHEGICRMFEEGYVIHEVAQVSGHRDLNTLWRIYTHLKAEKLLATRKKREARELDLAPSRPRPRKR